MPDQVGRPQAGCAAIQAIGGGTQGGSGIDDRTLHIRPAGCPELPVPSQILKVQGQHRNQAVQRRHHIRQAGDPAVTGFYRCLQVQTACAEEVPEHRRGQLSFP